MAEKMGAADFFPPLTSAGDFEAFAEKGLKDNSENQKTFYKKHLQI